MFAKLVCCHNKKKPHCRSRSNFWSDYHAHQIIGVASSIATCAGYFALKFCRSRKIATEGMSVSMKYDWDKDQKRYPKMNIELQWPVDFPEKYKDAIIRAMDQCVVKKHILEPPEFEISVV